MTEATVNSTYTILKDAMPSAYEAFVYSKWLRSLKHGNDYYTLINNDSYYGAYPKYLNNLLHHQDTVLRFAVLSDDKDVVLGFSVANKKTLHYIYVQPDMRKQGIATSLLPPDIEEITHLTKTGLIIWSNKYYKWKFNPFG